MKMQESVLARVRMVEEKNGIKYAKPGGRLHKVMRVLYTLLFAYTMGINLIFIAGMFITDNYKNFTDALITVCVCTGLIIAGYVLSFFKFKLIAGIISVIPEILLIVTFGAITQDPFGFMGFKKFFFWRHFIPLALMIITMSVAVFIAVRARIKTERQYKKVMDNLYRIYNENGGDITDDQWDNFLKEYDPSDYTKLFKANE